MEPQATAPANPADRNHIYYNDSDRIIWEEELDEFVPRRLFDAHIHLWSDACVPDGHEALKTNFPCGMDLTEQWNRRMFPGREIDYLIVGMPCPGMDTRAHNAFLAREISNLPRSRVNLLVTPDCSANTIRAEVKRHAFLGLKPYRLYSVTGDVDQCRIHEFLTHPQMEVANELGLWVTMHLSRYDGCADAENLRDLEEYTTRRYPKIKWILAHCGRSFTYWAISKGVDRLRAMPNIWYDNSAVSDVMAHYTLFKREDHRRIFYGSDNLVANSFHGRYVPMGRFWYQMEGPAYAQQEKIHTDARPVLAIYDQLLAMKHAAQLAGLSPSQLEDIFDRNARRAFGIDPAA